MEGKISTILFIFDDLLHLWSFKRSRSEVVAECSSRRLSTTEAKKSRDECHWKCVGSPLKDRIHRGIFLQNVFPGIFCDKKELIVFHCDHILTFSAYLASILHFVHALFKILFHPSGLEDLALYFLAGWGKGVLL